MSVFAEVKSALSVLTIIHLAAFAIMIGYRLHTQQYYIAEANIARELTKIAEAEAHAEILRIKQKPKQNKTIHNPLEKYQAQVQLLTKNLLEARASMTEKSTALDGFMDKLQILEEKNNDSEKSSIDLLQIANKAEDDNDSFGDDVSSSLSQWREFLSVRSLREIHDNDLRDFFNNAEKDILALVEHGDDRDDSRQDMLAKRFIFDTGLGASIDKEPSVFVCPEPLTGLEIGSNDENTRATDQERQERLEDAAYESDLEPYLKNFEEKFRNRLQARGIHALLPESIEFVENDFEQKIESVLDEIDTFADKLEDRLETKTSCIDPELVTEMVSAGLNAQMAQADVQQAIRKSIRQYDADISVDNLILDADLSGNTGSCGDIAKIKSINLRSTIDSPLLVKSIEWIDVLIDAIGGYNDDLDQYLDYLTGLHGTPSVGEIVVEGILDVSGRVGDIDIEKYSKTLDNIAQSITGSRR